MHVTATCLAETVAAVEAGLEVLERQVEANHASSDHCIAAWYEVVKPPIDEPCFSIIGQQVPYNIAHPGGLIQDTRAGTLFDARCPTPVFPCPSRIWI
jgi:hypothetical protein